MGDTRGGVKPVVRRLTPQEARIIDQVRPCGITEQDVLRWWGARLRINDQVTRIMEGGDSWGEDPEGVIKRIYDRRMGLLPDTGERRRKGDQ